MPTPAERQALLFVATVAALGVGVRACRAAATRAPDADARRALAVQLAQVDSAIASGRAPRARGLRDESSASAPSGRPPPRTRRGAGTGSGAIAPRAVPSPPPAAVAPAPPAPEAPIDVDRADAATLDRLPGIGPALAARIVEDRSAHGPFGSVEALARVRGIGPALVERLRPRVTFSGAPRPSDTEVPVVRRRGRRP